MVSRAAARNRTIYMQLPDGVTFQKQLILSHPAECSKLDAFARVVIFLEVLRFWHIDKSNDNSFWNPVFHWFMWAWRTFRFLTLQGNQELQLKAYTPKTGVNHVVMEDAAIRPSSTVKYYEQGNATISRKKLTPMLANYFEA